eukprot:tig00000093_g3606.t1
MSPPRTRSARGEVKFRYYATAASAGEARIVSTREPVMIGSPGARADPWMYVTSRPSGTLRALVARALSPAGMYTDTAVSRVCFGSSISTATSRPARSVRCRAREEEASSASRPVRFGEGGLLEGDHVQLPRLRAPDRGHYVRPPR